MSSAPTPRRSGEVTQPKGRTPDARGPSNIDYVAAEAVGFEVLPDALRRMLAKLFVGTELACDAEPTVTKRRPDGSHYQLASGWWASTERLVVIEGRRPLERVDDGRFRACGEWRPSGEVMVFPSGLVAASSRWRFEGGTDRGSMAARRGVADALDALPPALAAPVVGGQSNAWRRYRRGWALEVVVAMRRVEGRVRVLRAEREATSRRALAGADWVVATLDAPIVSRDPIAPDAGSRTRIGGGSRANELRRLRG